MRDAATKQVDQGVAPIQPVGVRPDGLTEAEAAKQRTMKIIVAALGVLILLAFAGVIAGMVYRASQIGKGLPGGKPGIAVSVPAKTAGTADPALAALAGSLQPDIKLLVPSGSTVKSVTLSGSRLVVHHEGPGGAGILILDLASGQVVSRVTIERER